MRGVNHQFYDVADIICVRIIKYRLRRITSIRHMIRDASGFEDGHLPQRTCNECRREIDCNTRDIYFKDGAGRMVYVVDGVRVFT